MKIFMEQRAGSTELDGMNKPDCDECVNNPCCDKLFSRWLLVERGCLLYQYRDGCIVPKDEVEIV